MKTLSIKSTVLGLSSEIQEHIERAYQESFDKKKIITHYSVKSQFSKWLSK
jgi:hypothetical protein